MHANDKSKKVDGIQKTEPRTTRTLRDHDDEKLGI